MFQSLPSSPLVALLASWSCAAVLEAQQVPDPAVVRGRCVAEETGVGLPGCTVRVSYVSGGKAVPAAQCPAPVTTTASGAYELAVSPPDGSQVFVRVTAKGRVPVRFRAEAAELGGDSKLDVELQRGVRVRGWMRDEQGKPVAGKMTLYVTSDLARPRAPGPSQRPDQKRSPFHYAPCPSTFTARSERMQPYPIEVGADGKFELEQLVPAGTAQLHLHVRGMFAVDKHHYQFVAGVPARLEVVMRPLPRMEGVVVDELGDPVEGVWLRAKNYRYGPGMIGVSDAQGRFVIHRTGPALDEAPLVVLESARCEPHEELGPFAWGNLDVRVELERSPRVQVRVLRARDGSPVEQFAVRSFPIRCSHRETQLQLAGEHRDGRVRVPVRREPSRLVVVPDDPRLMYRVVDVHGADRMKPIVVRLEHMVPMQIDVVDSRGEPAAGVIVEMVLPGNARKRDTVLDARADIMNAISNDPNIRFATIVHRATTDPGGRCIVFGPPSARRLDLRLSRPRTSHRWRRNVRLADGVREVVW